MGRVSPALVFLAGVLIAAQTLFAQEGGIVRGRVVDAKSGLPIANAEVALNYNERRKSTGADGGFEFKNLLEGNYYIQVDAQGYIQYSGYPKERFHVGSGRVASGFVIRMHPNGSSISGRVRNVSGESIKAHVELRGKQDPTYFRSMRTEAGEYRFSGLPPKSYILYAYEVGSRERLYAPAFYPNTTDRDWAGVIALAPGEEKEKVNIMLRPEKWQRIRGHFAGSCPKDHECEVHYERVPSPPSSSYSPANVATGGRFELRLPAGKMRLTVQAHSRRYGDRARLGSVEVDIGDTYPALAIEDMEIPASPGYPVDIRIVSPEPLPKGREGLEVMLLPIPLRGDNYHFWNVENEPFRFPHVAPGHYGFAFRKLPDGYYVQAIEAEGRDIQSLGLLVNGPSPPITIRLVKGVGGLRGRVVNDKQEALSTCQIRVRRQNASEAESRLYNAAASCSREGEFVVKNLAPGRYSVEASGTGEAKATESIRLAVGEVKELKLQLPHKAAGKR